MSVPVIVLTVLVVLLFLAAGIPKITAAPRTVEQADHLGVPRGLYRLVGVLEVLGAAGVVVGLWLPWLGAAAGVGLVLLMLGAVGSHLRAKDPLKALAPAVLAVVLAGAYVVLAV